VTTVSASWVEAEEPKTPSAPKPKYSTAPWAYRGVPDMASGVDREPIRFFDRAGDQCAWPTGPVDEPGQMDMAICGAPTDGACYCSAHRKMSRDGVKRSRPNIPPDANVKTSA
jgi:hypothetical protein